MWISRNRIVRGRNVPVDLQYNPFGGNDRLVRRVPDQQIEQEWDPTQDDIPPELGIVKLPSGVVYEAPEGFDEHHDRGHGWEHIKKLPGIEEANDIGEVLRAPNAIEQDGRYNIVIGDNPGADGQVILRLLGGTIISASEGVSDPLAEQDIEIPESLYDKIIHEKQDWDHSVIGSNREEVLETIRTVIEQGDGADELWKDTARDRWMYVKEGALGGEEVTVVAFVMNGELQTIFAPTHRQVDGPAGHSEEYIEWYIKSQQMIKEFENKEIVPDIEKGERGEPEPKPDPE